jgi:hypothetical protein
MAVPSTRRLVAQTRQRRLDAARPEAPARVAAEDVAAARLRQVTADRKDVARWAHRRAHRRAMVAWADGLHYALGPLPASPDPERPRLEAARAPAHRVLADRDEPDQGDPVRRVVAPEARCGQPGASCAGSRRESSLDADSDRLPALHLRPGHGDEARATPTRLAAEERAQGHAGAAVSSEGMGWNGEVWRAVSAPAGRGVEVSGPPPALAETPVCGPEACILAAEPGVVTGPGGPPTATKERRANHPGGKVVFARRQGAGCRQHARGLVTRPQKQGRRVLKTADQAASDAVRARATTPGSAAVRPQPPRVARQLAARVRYHDGRRRRYRGQWRVPVPYLRTGLVVHVTRLVMRLRPQGAQLAPQIV